MLPRHVDWEFKFHSSGRIVRRGDNTDEQTLERWDTFKVENDRCLYENEDILVTHSIVHFPNGSTDAVMMVHMKKDGLLWRTETGSHRCQRSERQVVEGGPTSLQPSGLQRCDEKPNMSEWTKAPDGTYVGGSDWTKAPDGTLAEALGPWCQTEPR